MLFEVRNLGKSFVDGESRRFVFRHLSLSFPNRGMYGILGGSGSGKSTFLSLLSGLTTPDEGYVRFDGCILKGLDDKGQAHFRNDEIGLVFQHYNLLNGFSCFENVLLPSLLKGKGNGAKAEALLKELGLESKKKQDVGTLSGGEKQRVAICRALVNSPKALLCDEPTGALDKSNAMRIMNILKRISESRLVLIVSHDTDLISPFLSGCLLLPSGEVKGGLR